MKHEYKIGGMTCNSCAAKIKSALLLMPDVSSVEVDKATDKATIEMTNHIALSDFQEALTNVDSKYSIAPVNHSEASEQVKSWFKSYKPIILVFFYILLVTLSIQYLNTEFDFNKWMRHFMSAFFLVFSFFKILDLSGFADSYMSYDIIAKKWRGWGYVYAFVELSLLSLIHI